MWQIIANRKQAERQSRIPPEWLIQPHLPRGNVDVLSSPQASGILTPSEITITTKYDATSLASAIRFRYLTAEAVTIAFCKRAAIAQQVCNCLTEIFFAEAIERARFLDREFARTGRTLGPLHGVPVSFKDSFKVKGYDACIGIASLAENPAKENSLLVDILLEQGAVLYCKTNVSQGMLAFDSENNVFGRVLNPRNPRVTAGGSSGGEGALLAMRGSVLGVGTDIGGSVRVPAMCNGLYSIRPSIARVPYVGQEDGERAGARAIGAIASVGPMTTTMRDCDLFLRVISNARPWERDPAVNFGNWESQGVMQKKPLLGVIRTDSKTTPLPPVVNVLDEVIQAIRVAGIEVIEVSAPALANGQSILNQLISIDGGNTIFDLLERTGEPWSTWLHPRMRRRPRMDLLTLQDVHARKSTFEKEMLKVWKDARTGRPLDAIICPVAPHPVPPIDSWNGMGYTASWVILDCPAGSLPVRDITETDLEEEVTTESLGTLDQMNRLLWDAEGFDRNIYLNTTLSIQVVAPKLQERRLCQAMALIDSILSRGAERAKL